MLANTTVATQVQPLKMKKFAIRNAETVKTTKPAMYPIWQCVG